MKCFHYTAEGCSTQIHMYADRLKSLCIFAQEVLPKIDYKMVFQSFIFVLKHVCLLKMYGYRKEKAINHGTKFYIIGFVIMA